MNWRRLMSSMGSSPEPAVPAYRRVRVFRKLPQVLGADLNRSESWWERCRPPPVLPPQTIAQARYGKTAALRDFDPAYDRSGSCVTSAVMSIGGAQLYER